MPQRWREVFSDGIEWQLFRVCPVCKGSGTYPRKDARAYSSDPPEGPCRSCSRGIRVERFETSDELKRFVSSLPDEPSDDLSWAPGVEAPATAAPVHR
jgi:hypothetical protein